MANGKAAVVVARFADRNSKNSPRSQLPIVS